MHPVAPGFGQAGEVARLRVSTFQYKVHYSSSLIYCGIFQITINLLSSEYSDASKGTQRTRWAPGGNAIMCADHALHRLSVIYIIYGLLHNFASFHVFYVFAR